MGREPRACEPQVAFPSGWNRESAGKGRLGGSERTEEAEVGLRMEKVEREHPQPHRAPSRHSPGCDSSGLHLPPPAESVWGRFLGRERVPGALPPPPQLWRIPPFPALPCRPRPWKLLPPFPQLAANSSGAAWRVLPQNCSGEGRAASPPLAALLPCSPCPLQAAQRRSLPAICCPRLGIETKHKPRT